MERREESTDPAKLSKKELNKLKAREKKAAAIAAKKAQEPPQQVVDLSKYSHLFGTRPLVEAPLKNSQERRVYVAIDQLTAKLHGSKVWVRGRIHRVRKAGSGMCFITLRQRWATVQVLAQADEEGNVPLAMVNWLSKIKPESIIDVYATVSRVQEKIESTSQQDVELKPITAWVVSGVRQTLPLRVQDASIPESLLEAQRRELVELDEKLKKAREQLEQLKVGSPSEEEAIQRAQKEVDLLTDTKGRAVKYVDVDQSTRLDNRIIDLRTAANQAIFAIQSATTAFFREYLISQSFIEIHTPKLVGEASEGGAEVFAVKYFERNAYLAQSPQFYKQMAIGADFDRVFEIGPVFRAERSDTPRHMTEFTGVDIEMQIYQHYHEVLTVLSNLFTYTFAKIEKHFAPELEIINQQYPFRPIKYLEETPILKYVEIIDLLRDAGVDIGYFDDLNAAQERMLGEIIYRKYQTDFYIIDKFPSQIRPFYSMACPEDPNYANAYDMFIRGEEMCSGAQRIHDPEMLTQRAIERGVDPPTIKNYIDTFCYGAPPHGGGGIGLERVVMLYLGLNNIRKTAMFPRDPYRLLP
ncbi:aspartate--tRNA ligase, cytoplasmic-like [Schistocerca gregaria]|uniref:aspartate--tRNA ligase, cytoplasmic-like n=1 Tax=Schistocerca gregaria TaxID=7010 RepID=UPI00211E9F48|nr:aspartate--tRNA ligase, cytoplasmic-like [Schistocerca gregaria]